MTSTVVSDPKPADRYSAPTTASGFDTKRSLAERPICTPLAPEARPPKMPRPTRATMIGRLLTPRPSFAHRPVSLLLTPPTFGATGQKIQRPKLTSAAGSTKSAAIMARNTPVAQAIPRARVPSRPAKVRVESARITVRPEAMIAGAAPRQAARIASRRSAYLSSSSR